MNWHLDPYAPHWLPSADLYAVMAWMAENGVVDADGGHLVTVTGDVITYWQDKSPAHVRRPDRTFTRTTTPLLTPPPTVYQPSCDAATLTALIEVFEQHGWSEHGGVGGTCVPCSDTRTDEHGRVFLNPGGRASWPCIPVRQAMAQAGVPLDAPQDDQYPMLVLGDTLDPVANALAFGRTDP